jgi:hypothetical protein
MGLTLSMGRLGKSPTSLNLAEGVCRESRSHWTKGSMCWRSWILGQGDLKQLGSRLARQCIMHSGRLFLANERVLRGPSASEHRRTSVPAPPRVSALSHMGFSHRRSVLKATYLGRCTVYLGTSAHRPYFGLSVHHFSALLFPASPSLFCR